MRKTKKQAGELNQVQVIIPEEPMQAPMPNEMIAPSPQPINYSYFYSPPPIQPDEVFYFERPRKELDLKLFESIDPRDFVHDGDIQSVEFYLKNILGTKVTGRNTQLGSPGMSNAFTILQLGAQYLCKLRQNRFLPFGASPTANGDAYVMSLNEQLIANSNAQIEELSGIITQLEFQISRMQTDVNRLRLKRRKIENVVDKVEKYNLKKSLQKKKKHHKKKHDDNLSEGQVPPSEIQRYNKIQVELGRLK